MSLTLAPCIPITGPRTRARHTVHPLRGGHGVMWQDRGQLAAWSAKSTRFWLPSGKLGAELRSEWDEPQWYVKDSTEPQGPFAWAPRRVMHDF